MLLTVVACGTTGRTVKIEGGKREFYVGEEFSCEGLTVVAVDEKGNERILQDGEYTVDSSAFDGTRAGKYEIVVRTEDLSTAYRVEVVEHAAVPVSLSISASKTIYAVGDPFNSNNLEIYIAFSDGTSRKARHSEYKIDESAYKSDAAGDYEIIVRLLKSEVEGSIIIKVRDLMQLKILMIGNSFSDDTSQYVWNIANSMGVNDVVVGNMYIGGCSLNMHWTNASGDLAKYEYRKNMHGTWGNTSGVRLSTAIQDEDWDFISLQQGSADGSNRTDPISYVNLENMVNYVRNLCPRAKLLWNMTWADEEYSTRPEITALGHDQMKHYRGIVEATKSTVKPVLPFISPVGTAIQNARTVLGDLTRDGFHLSYGVGRYIAGLTLVATLIDFDYTDSVYCPTNVTADQKAVALKAVKAAMQTPFDVTPLN